jgi:predicted negative regulator of RcsB-dependent stress response
VSLKDDINYVKEELSSDEKLLESAFRLEKFYKKHRVKIWVLVGAAILGFGGKAGYEAYRDYKLHQANAAWLTLQKNPADQAALEQLRSNNPALYRLYLYDRGVKKRDTAKLQEVKGSSDALLADLAGYHIPVLASKPGDSRYYEDLSRIEKAYLALKAGKKGEARRLLALIGENSPVAGIARLLRHGTLK